MAKKKSAQILLRQVIGILGLLINSQISYGKKLEKHLPISDFFKKTK
jgi:hypothetical protein